MKSVFHFIIIALISILASCTNQQTKEPRTKQDKPVAENTEPSNGPPTQSGEVLPHSKIKNGIELSLVRVMEGGACKDDNYGARGVFLVYANPNDIERIKAEEGKAVFGNFEKQIRDFALLAFQKAVIDSDLTIDPFALDANDAQRKAADDLTKKFSANVADDIDAFTRETGLNADVEPLRRSFIFYMDGCEATHLHDNP